MTETQQTADWIAAEYSEYSAQKLHVWIMQGAEVLAERSASCDRARLKETLATVCADLRPDQTLPLILSGDTTDLHAVPHKPADLRPVAEAGSGPVVIHRLPGLRQAAPTGYITHAATRLAGFITLNPNWDGVVCLPDARSCWAQLSAGEVVSFQCFSSLRMLQTLATQATADWCRDSFADALSDTMSRPERLAARLSEAQAGQDLGELDAKQARGRALGALLGAELAATRAYWLGQNLALIGDPADAAGYAAALEQQGLPVTIADAKRMALAGLSVAYRTLTGG